MDGLVPSSNESLAGMYNQQVDMSFRWGMGWFIFSKVMFIGALFYARLYAIPWFDGGSNNDATHSICGLISKPYGHC